MLSCYKPRSVINTILHAQFRADWCRHVPGQPSHPSYGELATCSPLRCYSCSNSHTGNRRSRQAKKGPSRRQIHQHRQRFRATPNGGVDYSQGGNGSAASPSRHQGRLAERMPCAAYTLEAACELVLESEYLVLKIRTFPRAFACVPWDHTS